MARKAWSRLLAGSPDWFGAPGAFPIAAYSEFQGPVRLNVLPYGTVRTSPVQGDRGWQVSEREEAVELQPGLDQVAAQIIPALARLGRGEPAHGIARGTLEKNPYWTPQLAAATRGRTSERYVSLLPLALSRTQDALGRIRWTLFGASEHGPGWAFWRSFFAPAGKQRPATEGLAFFRRLLIAAYREPPGKVADLHGAGLRILPQGRLDPPLPDWSEGPLPRWTEPLVVGEDCSLEGVRYLVTFRPFSSLPQRMQQAYATGALHLIPFPGSLLFWGAPLFLQLHRELPAAPQIALLWHVERHAGPGGLRVPQSGWMHEPRPDDGGPPAEHGPLRNTYRRTTRYVRVRRDAPAEQMVSAREDRTAHVLFDASEAIGLYGKPMARNAQLWTPDGRLLLDGPAASHDAIEQAARAVAEGGLFGYRFLFPAMRVGRHEVVWHRPLVAYLSPGGERPIVVPAAPLGVLTASPESGAGAWTDAAIELWPELLARAPYVAAMMLFRHTADLHPHQTARNCRKLLVAREALGRRPLPRSFARRLLTVPETETLDQWLDALPARSDDPARGRWLADDLRRRLEPEQADASAPGALTFPRTARRTFEVAYWNAMAALSSGRFPNRNNADCARDAATRRALGHFRPDLEAVGDFLLARHTRAIAAAGMQGRALVGDLPFRWRTDFAYTWSDGWLRSQEGEPRERDLIVIIPGRQRDRAVIMADHYDTAYMEDRYRERTTRNGPRLSAPGADDNGSATAALLMAAPCLLELSRAGRLDCDVWLVHLTGEEFPADCMGARHLVQCLVEGTLAVRLPGGATRDLSGTRVQGVFVLDMVAHDNPRRRGVFQIAPGDSPESYRLALAAHTANEAWNAAAPRWNQHPARHAKPARRPASKSPVTLPPIAQHPLLHGEIRPHDDPRSTLYNTDGQIFSDAGIPVVLFMEDYDIDRTGYHDSRDTMAGIDLDFGAALAAIAIEAVARAASLDC